MTAPKTRTITLTDRRPVTIRQDEWPILAIGDERDGSSHLGETERYTLRVRQHADGRVIVYGVHTTGKGTSSRDWRGGELWIPPTRWPILTPLNMAAAIRRVGESGQFPDAVIRACIAALPAERL